MDRPPITEDLVNKETQGRYKFVKTLGRGAYGVVFAAIEKATGKEVAVKHVDRVFESPLDAKRCLREVKILSQLNHENITNLVDISCLPDYENFKGLAIVMDLMDTDMCQIINSGQPLLVEHHRYFIYQLLRGLKYLHSANILHRDLKPSNLLLNSDCDLKIADFGLARISEPDEPQEFLSEYVATRWYRAPEVLLNYDTYGAPMDMWSVGCITAELVLRHPLFRGTSTRNQLELITQILGSPTDKDLEGCTNQKAYRFMQQLPPQTKVPWEELFQGKTYNPEEIDFIDRLLKWNPNERMTVEEALEHPFVVKLHDPFDEPVGFPFEEFDFERQDVTVEELKMEMWKEILKRHPKFE
ncbi:CMGC family protein kinase [Trichomonas vaginalis G3]|uniref:Mitogen-activated protein kinase n=1 Tax=Trichomonas vaginalis (strain ATCC PRA-98 / G3) TaxID=412133 RepID=A2F7V2_TRIV3|nr:STKc MAPK domain-containing protein [Trichomonas vaginalis G3]EAX99031.1 CMGC family protein kinase [Trichomonas vaginalis G3]KAI5539506.1 STKc MAPK domain-containing protein [Trichomonas vaginalis G3]|eukprot:XP_001311961.1 CMGC family protein kinase [Trichomonas vaginalis G3]